mmetsp:Transcript_28586/g.82769  ORF Transcript_28586/g.82769 Transcript_28586/m.82769 type:complete len:229 (+) Transcript_28586:1610-2296(+)
MMAPLGDALETVREEGAVLVRGREVDEETPPALILDHLLQEGRLRLGQVEDVVALGDAEVLPGEPADNVLGNRSDLILRAAPAASGGRRRSCTTSTSTSTATTNLFRWLHLGRRFSRGRGQRRSELGNPKTQQPAHRREAVVGRYEGLHRLGTTDVAAELIDEFGDVVQAVELHNGIRLGEGRLRLLQRQLPGILPLLLLWHLLHSRPSLVHLHAIVRHVLSLLHPFR